MSTIFVLEDEALIRMMIVEMVEELGHRIVADAGNIPDALPLAETAPFDLALLDINIGGHTSVDVAAILERRRLPMLFVTGYTFNCLPSPFCERPLLRKPFQIEELKGAIDRALMS
jgi:CheY-like chemotaxis protein